MRENELLLVGQRVADRQAQEPRNTKPNGENNKKNAAGKSCQPGCRYVKRDGDVQKLPLRHLVKQSSQHNSPQD